MIGLKELPVKIGFLTEKEAEATNKMVMGEDTTEYYRKLLEEEKQLPNPDPEKIKEFENHIAIWSKDIEEADEYFEKVDEAMRKIKRGRENLEHYGELLENEKQMPHPNSKKIKEFEKQIIIWSKSIEEGQEFFKE
jgi:predicted ribosome quality control (RQC) complex YloA/Tae2 family protein